jgi:Protein of unknown function (DUF4236)
MPWNLRFNKRISIIPGIRVNISKLGPSVSIGTRGAWFTVGRKSHRTTLSLPGTGLSMTRQDKGGVGVKGLIIICFILLGLFLITHIGGR